MTVQSIADAFIEECIIRLQYNYDKKSFIKEASYIESCLFNRDVGSDDYEDIAHVSDLTFISDEWWNTYEELDYKDQVEVMNYIKDVFPDTWRP
jgi:hypothetical protein